MRLPATTYAPCLQLRRHVHSYGWASKSTLRGKQDEGKDWDELEMKAARWSPRSRTESNGCTRIYL